MGKKMNPAEGRPLDAEELKMLELKQLNKELNAMSKRQKQLIKKKLQNIMEGKTKADYKMRIFGKKGR